MDPFSQKNFQKISSMVLYPLFDLSICHYGGDTGGGTPTIGGYAVLHGGVYMWITYIPLPVCHSVMWITICLSHTIQDIPYQR
jgi:hypothetical protein